MSLYTCLNILNQPGVNIATVEDPAEINLPGINQVNVNDRAGLTFAAALKSFLRQDPDIIMVGEIRDLETADIAIKAAQTGHMVMSTLHTNDAPTTLTRLLNMGVAPFNIASSVLLITAQRLARKLCENCKKPADYPRESMLKAGFKPEDLDGNWKPYRAVGCSACNNGYKGRVGIYQVMPITEAIQRIILSEGTALDIAKQAQAEGVRDLRQSGLIKVRSRCHDARGSDHRHQRVARRLLPTQPAPPAHPWPPQHSSKTRQGNHLRVGRQGPNGKIVRGEMRAGGESVVNASLRRQGILVSKVKKRRTSGGRSIKQRDIAIFTRQLATMMKAGVPLLQSFDIVARGSTNPRMTKLLTDIRSDVETGTSLSAAFRKHPLHFDALYCNLVEAGEAGGILEALLDRLAIYQEKTLAIKSKIKSALMYPIAVIVVAFVVLTVIMIFVIPAFKDVFKSFGGDLPAPTLVVIAMSEVLRQVVVGDLRPARRRRLLLPRDLEALREDADDHGPPAAQGADLRRPDQQVGDRALDAHAVDDVRRRRTAGRGARFGRRRLGQRRLSPRPPSRSRRTSPPARH